MLEFKAFPKISRLSRDILVTEKIDGTNGIIAIGENGEFQVGSRNKWLTDEFGNIQSDNAGFAQWATQHRDELMTLGVGYHYGEWWGKGIQRGYGLSEKRFSLFNVSRWSDESDEVRPSCCHVVPILFAGTFDTLDIAYALSMLELNGSVASPGFMRPEGVVIFHTPSGHCYKKTIENDEKHKGELSYNSNAQQQ